MIALQEAETEVAIGRAIRARRRILGLTAGEASEICTQISDGTARSQDGTTGPDLGPGRTPNQTHDLYPRGK